MEEYLAGHGVGFGLQRENGVVVRGRPVYNGEMVLFEAVWFTTAKWCCCSKLSGLQRRNGVVVRSCLVHNGEVVVLFEAVWFTTAK
ncbi:hypothetical protein AALF85_06280 [Jeotgalicoccus halotolerans]|uniref:hypothetical protein n=1 Tax=Jeotgalicoccus halotolerans TaxID=157227 RepID=UPI00351507E0